MTSWKQGSGGETAQFGRSGLGTAVRRASMRQGIQRADPSRTYPP